MFGLIAKYLAKSFHSAELAMLENKLKEALLECERLKESSEKEAQRSEFLGLEVSRLKKELFIAQEDCVDLSLQLNDIQEKMTYAKELVLEVADVLETAEEDAVNGKCPGGICELKPENKEGAKVITFAPVTDD